MERPRDEKSNVSPVTGSVTEQFIPTDAFIGHAAVVYLCANNKEMSIAALQRRGNINLPFKIVRAVVFDNKSGSSKPVTTVTEKVDDHGPRVCSVLTCVTLRPSQCSVRAVSVSGGSYSGSVQVTHSTASSSRPLTVDKIGDCGWPSPKAPPPLGIWQPAFPGWNTHSGADTGMHKLIKYLHQPSIINIDHGYLEVKITHQRTDPPLPPKGPTLPKPLPALTRQTGRTRRRLSSLAQCMAVAPVAGMQALLRTRK